MRIFRQRKVIRLSCFREQIKPFKTVAEQNGLRLVV